MNSKLRYIIVSHCRNDDVDKKDQAVRTTVVPCLDTGEFQYPGKKKLFKYISKLLPVYYVLFLFNIRISNLLLKCTCKNFFICANMMPPGDLYPKP